MARKMVRRKKNSPGKLRVGFYLLYLSIFVLMWIFAILYFTSAFQHKPVALEPFQRDQYLTAIFTAVFFAVLGILAILIVIADLHFERTGKWWMDIPLDIFTFRNAQWWEIPVGFFIAIVLLIYSATTHSLLLPLPFATAAGATPFAEGAASPEALKVMDSTLTQAGLTGAVAPIENAALMNFPIATLTSLLVFVIFRFGRKKVMDAKAIMAYRVFIIPVALLVGFIAIKVHSLIYPPEVMQTTAISTFLFFSIGGVVSGYRRSTLIWDIAHFSYNFGAIIFAIVSLSISVFV